MNRVIITADDIKRLLKLRHSDDVFITECKTGPTWCANGMQKFDAWAMNKSWANPCVYGYEVKVSRSDFLSDDKWRGYLPYCNQFYFVAPCKVISPEELPPEVGLIWTSQNGHSLLTKRKAAYRNVSIPEDIWRYILMSRVAIIDERSTRSKLQYWKDWLAEKEEAKTIGWNVSKKLFEKYQNDVEKVSKKQDELEEIIKGYETIRQTIKEFGFDPNSPYSHWRVKDKLRELAGGIPSHFSESINGAIQHLKDVQKKISTLAENHSESKELVA